MQSISDLGIILKTFPYQDRDQVCVLLTQNHGKVTGVAKNGRGAKRFGGALRMLTCSRLRLVQKPNRDMVRIDEAITHHEFSSLEKDFEKFTIASFMAEFCLRMIEPEVASDESFSKEIFIIMSNALFYLDQSAAPLLVLNAFLLKSFNALGYSPSLFHCTSCSKPANTAEPPFFWDSQSGGMLCAVCNHEKSKKTLNSETIVYASSILTRTFKELAHEFNANSSHSELFPLLTDFLHHHLPGVPSQGFNSWSLLNQTLRPVL